MKRDTLLIVDDSELDLAILNEIFKTMFQVVCMKTTRSARNYLEKNQKRICAVLLDICMESPTAGLFFLEELQHKAELAGIPVILIASDANREYVMEGIRNGAVDFLAKPVNPQYVQERVEETIRKVWKDELELQTGEKKKRIFEHTGDAAPFSQPSDKTSTEEITAMWTSKLMDFLRFRTVFSLQKFHGVHGISTLLTKAYVAAHPYGKLSIKDASIIGCAATFYDIGLLGIPDEIIKGGPNQEEPGRTMYFNHLELGKNLFQHAGPPHPFLDCCADIAYWHHKNVDGTGYPITDGPVEIPLSAQLVHTALLCNEYISKFVDQPNYYDLLLDELSKDVGKAISKEMYEVVELAREQLQLLVRVLYVK